MNIFEIQSSSLEELSEYCRKINQFNEIWRIEKERKHHYPKNRKSPIRIRRGFVHDEETRKKIGLARKAWIQEHGHPFKGIKGEKHYLFGTKWSNERRKKTIKSIKKFYRNLKKSNLEKRRQMRLNDIGKRKYFENGEWFDINLSKCKYKKEFRNLREFVRERFNRRCMICFEIENNRKHCIHHIDYNRTNNDINNLIPLCLECHNKTNLNRKYWMDFFIGFIKILKNN